MELSKAYQI